MVAPQALAGRPGQTQLTELTALVKTELSGYTTEPGFLACTGLDLTPSYNPYH